MKTSIPILNFRGPHRWLSNFYPVIIVADWCGEPRTYGSVEHAYQAAKTLDPSWERYVREAPTPGAAKYRGQQVSCRPQWDEIKIDVMLGMVRIKFACPFLSGQLLATGDAHLEEGNTHGDRFWGTVMGLGENHLGKILMQVRTELREGGPR